MSLAHNQNPLQICSEGDFLWLIGRGTALVPHIPSKANELLAKALPVINLKFSEKSTLWKAGFQVYDC